MQLMPFTTNVLRSNPTHGDVFSIQLYLIKFVYDFGQVGDFPVFSINKTECNDISEILLKVALTP
jgi:hypothetical protein